MSSRGADTVIWDAVVVGAGVEGSATAYHLAKNKQRTLMLEQFGIPHSRGSSHGQSRTIRYGYPQDYYTAMMPEAFKIWNDIERQADMTLIRPSKLLTLDAPLYWEYEQKGKILKKAGIHFEELSNKDVMKMFPFVKFEDEYKGMLEDGAGIIRADKALLTLQQLFVRDGGVIQDEEKLLDISPGPILTLRTNKGTHRARNVILTPGPWAKKVLNPLGLHLPLVTQRVRVCYWKEKSPGTCVTFPPCFFPRELVYVLPINEYPNMIKICHHGGPEIDPDNRDKADHIRDDIDFLEDFVGKHFPGIENKPSIVETCIYTGTPDEDFILDRHPHFRNIIVGVGFSGHGFKLAPVVGKILCELALDKEPSYDLSHFAINRFQRPPKANL
ncbi:peroxisomal sarcosine oxidase-like [Ptychodera flava]|uniref:peroxisomal sarcosine oxidase-like n=1 Tax=Ptychodera flava TaxID=63121 RepID=UPI00396A56DA